MIAAVVAPLVRGSTYRRGVHQLLGGVILLPYILLGVAFVQLFRGAELPLGAVLVLAAVAALIAATPAFLDGTRAVEIVAARGLLDVDLPDPIARADREARLRSALWFALHLLFGGLTGFGLFAALPVAFVFVARQFGAGAELGPLADVNPALVSLIGVAMLLVIVYVVAGLGALAAQVAPALLGPSQAEEIAALQERAERLAERNRLARELHDSVGHALTVTTIQAAAAQRLVDADPEFVRKALTAIEETGRAAMEDLDHVLGLLREEGTDRPAPVRTLADVDRIVADARAAGLTVDVARRRSDLDGAGRGVAGGLPDRPRRTDQRRPARGPGGGDAADRAVRGDVAHRAVQPGRRGPAVGPVRPRPGGHARAGRPARRFDDGRPRRRLLAGRGRPADGW